MQGRFKRDGSAAAEQEPRGGTDRGSSPQHPQSQGAVTGGAPTDHAQAPGAAGPAHSGRTARAGRAAGAAPSAEPADGKPAGPGKGKAAKGPKSPSDTGPRIALRNWRISTRLVSLLALPVVAATTLGGMRISESMERMEQLDHMQLLTELTREATNLAKALQKERDESAGPLATGREPNENATVVERRDATDKAQKAFLNATDKIGDTQGDEALQAIRANVSQIGTQVVTLASIRQDAFDPKRQKSQTVDAYNRVIESLLSLSQDMAQATSNPEMIKRTRALAAFSSAKEYASMQRAIIAASLPGPAGLGKELQAEKINPNDRLYGEAARTNEDAALKSFQSIYASNGGNAEELLAPLNEGNAAIQEADSYATRALTDPMGISNSPRTFKDWADASGTKITAMDSIEATLLGEMETKARELRSESEREAIISGALILLVLGVSLVGAFVVSRSMIRSLRRLQDTATRVAQDRLPELVKQLSESDPQDVDTSVESVGVHSRDEIGQVAAAFDDVHREAVRLAAEQALLRGNVNAMFTNLSRRSQGLIQRQLSLISELESREADPDQLSSLFKLDHLATRMRRNGENLLVLAGEEPGRRWTRPVPLVDVLRAAASEVEQYERIELASVPPTEVAGRVVNDLVHLLAELLENATSFSSPQTKVRVTGHALPDGRVLVEIHDTGIGLSPEDLAAINERLASPPTVDVSVSRRMGLFVVGRLSLRHGIRIQLRPSDSGGTTALVMLPVDVAQGGRKPQKAGPGGQGAPSAPGGRLPGGPGQSGGGRPGLPGGSGGGGSAAGLLSAGAGAARNQGGGQGPRAALPGRDDAPGRPGGGPQQGGGLFGGGNGAGAGARPGQERPNRRPQPQDRAPARGGNGDQNLFGGPSAAGAAGTPGAPGTAGTTSSGLPSRSDVWGGSAPGPAGSQQPGSGTPQQPGFGNGSGAPGQSGFGNGAGGQAPGRLGGTDRPGAGPVPPAGRRDQGPGREQRPAAPDAQRPELPGGSAQGAPRPAATSWGAVPAQPGPARSATPQDGPRGHEEPDVTGGHRARDGYGQDRGGYGQGLPDGHGGRDGYAQDPGRDGYAQDPGHGGYAQDPGSTGQFARPGAGEPQHRNQHQGQAPNQGQGQNQGFAPERGQDPLGLPAGDGYGAPQRQDALPPAGAGDGRTPLYDTLETNWFHGAPEGGRPDQQGTPAANGGGHPRHDETVQHPVVPHSAQESSTTGQWRTSPNDELVRQAERARKPAAGGITTSGLPKRVPRANLVAGTAQEQNHQSGPQVSRAPDDVRGRLTNLRRGIQQGRQAGNSSTGSYDIGPSHQQER
ncbi:nitrate- and nitrite sensing domain-containing protein [Streptomyces sp. LP05-1]|uniref:histidine kinase n=1 Tax=Streptomyces pyxinae TaxID=2970734 RepID=A0ABT2CGU8_9ACTN|nr:nitrate- and nitrite sensing domain-containing protein [Streptomyces sp. LP05-1]MCS0636621.1 nitrate- and nitrite sensing domain-containing protein [Streptomyces sp. LP05-1]